MNGVTRFISFVIGLIILILLFVFISSRFNQSEDTQAEGDVTPTPAEAAEQEEGNFFTRLFGGDDDDETTPSPTPQDGQEQVDGEVQPQDGQAQDNQAQDSQNGEMDQEMTPTPTPEEEEGFNPFGIFGGDDPTPTPSPEPTLTFEEQLEETNQAEQQQDQSGGDDQEYQSLDDVEQIPNTGAPTLLLPLAAAGLALGAWLRKRA